MFRLPLPVLEMRQRKSGLLEMIGSAASQIARAVFVKRELVEDEIAGEAAGGARVGGEHLDAADLAVDVIAPRSASFVFEILAQIGAGIELVGIALVSQLDRLAELAADLLGI
jgi:hypothetical protein